MPLSQDLADQRMLLQQHMATEDFTAAILAAHATLDAEAQATGAGRILTLSVTPWLMGQPHRIRAFGAMLDAILARGGVWSATGAEIAAAWRAQQAWDVAAERPGACRARPARAGLEGAGPCRAVLVTRPEPGAAETAAACAALGWDAVLAPAMVLRETAPSPVAAGAGAAARLPRRRPRPGARPVAGPRGRGRHGRRGPRPRVHPCSRGGWRRRRACRCGRRRYLEPAAGPLLLAVGRGYGADLAAALRGTRLPRHPAGRLCRHPGHRPAAARARGAARRPRRRRAVHLAARSFASRSGCCAAPVSARQRGASAPSPSARASPRRWPPCPGPASTTTARPDPALLPGHLGPLPV